MENKNLLPIIDLFKISFDSYWRKLWQLAGVVLFGMSGLVILSILVLIGVAISFVPFMNGNFDARIIIADVFLALAGLFFVVFFGIWSRVALLIRAVDQADDIGTSVKSGWDKMASFFWISLLAGLATAIGLIAFIIPGIIFAVWFSFSAYVFVLEGTKGTAALKKSREMVKGYWWPVFGRLLAVSVVAVLISSIKGLGPILSAFFMGPFCMVYVYELYKDIKNLRS